jgi:hypothetical protein
VNVIRMPFGAHRGKLLADVPARYLAWLYTQKRLERTPFTDALRAEVIRRGAPDDWDGDPYDPDDDEEFRWDGQ